jgi:hypothetical protein
MCCLRVFDGYVSRETSNSKICDLYAESGSKSKGRGLRVFELDSEQVEENSTGCGKVLFLVTF